MRVIPGLRAYVKNLGKKFKMSPAQRSGVLRSFGMTKAGGGPGITAHTARLPQKKIAAMTPRELVAFAAPMILDSRPRSRSGGSGSNRHAAAIKAWETRRMRKT